MSFDPSIVDDLVEVYLPKDSVEILPLGVFDDRAGH
jgi:hypothetical protein